MVPGQQARRQWKRHGQSLGFRVQGPKPPRPSFRALNPKLANGSAMDKAISTWNETELPLQRQSAHGSDGQCLVGARHSQVRGTTLSTCPLGALAVCGVRLISLGTPGPCTTTQQHHIYKPPLSLAPNAL
jgi:hypothetical protein